MLPDEVEFVHGPGCPVCVLPMGRVDDCVALAERPEVIFTTFGDAMRVPGSRKSLLKAKADGADVRMVYSPLDALAMARTHPDREVIFFGLGFETTMPSTAHDRDPGAQAGHRQFLGVLQPYHHRSDHQGDSGLTRSAAGWLLGPGHVSMVIGTAPYEFIARHYRKPITIAGFEPLDVLHRAWMVLRQIAEGRCEVENQYGRVVPATATRGAGGRSKRSTNCASSSNGAAWGRSTIPACDCATPMRVRCRTEFACRMSGSPIRSRASAARC